PCCGCSRPLRARRRRLFRRDSVTRRLLSAEDGAAELGRREERSDPAGVSHRCDDRCASARDRAADAERNGGLRRPPTRGGAAPELAGHRKRPRTNAVRISKTIREAARLDLVSTTEVGLGFSVIETVVA